MARSILVLISILCSLLFAACGGASEPGSPAPVALPAACARTAPDTVWCPDALEQLPAGCTDNPPGPGVGYTYTCPPVCAWDVCSDCGQPHYVWTCDSAPTSPAPVGAAK